jgi:hypothetical protein
MLAKTSSTASSRLKMRLRAIPAASACFETKETISGIRRTSAGNTCFLLSSFIRHHTNETWM